MDAGALRQTLAAFLGAQRYRKFVEHIRQAGRMRFWQESVWAKFTAAHPSFAVTVQELQAALRICELHGCELQPGKVGVFHGCRDLSNRYLRVRKQKFPHAASEPVSTEGTPVEGNEAQVWFCPDCRIAEAAWKEQLSPTVTIEDLLFRKQKFPYLGVPLNDLLLALKAIEESTEIADKRVMAFRLYSDGHLLVTTGEQLGGCSGGGNKILLRKQGRSWVITEVTQWVS